MSKIETVLESNFDSIFIDGTKVILKFLEFWCEWFLIFTINVLTKHLHSKVYYTTASRHPWQKPQLPIFPPQGRFTGRSSLVVSSFFTSYRGSLAWSGAGTPVPCMTAAHTQGNANLWCNEKKLVSVENMWPSTLVCHFVRGDVSHDLMHHLPSLFFPPILDLPLSLLGICLH